MLAKSALLAFACLVLAVIILHVSNAPSKVIRPVPNVLSAHTTPDHPTLTPLPTLTPTATPTPTIQQPTPTSGAAGPKPAPQATPDLEQLFIKYSDEYSIDKDLLKRIAYCESGFNTTALQAGYAGLYQFSEVLWIQTRTLLGQNPDVDLRFNAEESIRTAAFMISQNHLYIWPHCGK